LHNTIHVATPIVDLEDVTSPSLDSIAATFAMRTITNFPTLESSIRRSRCVHTLTCLQRYLNVVETIEKLQNVMEIGDEPQSFQEVAKDPH